MIVTDETFFENMRQRYPMNTVTIPASALPTNMEIAGEPIRCIRDTWINGQQILEVHVPIREIENEVPEGYEHVREGGEYRTPTDGELWLGVDGKVYCEWRSDISFKRWILRPTAPEGFEHVGICRVPIEGEWCVSEYADEAVNVGYPYCLDWTINGGKRWILRKKWTPTWWLPEGCWVYRCNDGWYVSRHKPIRINDNYYGVEFRQTCLNVEHLADLYGETFEPPTHTNCLQVKHE